MAKATPGLRKRGKIWHIEKTVCRIKLRESTGTSDLAEAERILAARVRAIREKVIHGARDVYTFEDAAGRYLAEHRHKRSINRDVCVLERYVPHIGGLPLASIHDGTLAHIIEARMDGGIKAGTINREISVIRRILQLASRKWRDEQGRPWLDAPPLLSHAIGETRKPRPITHEEQSRLFRQLPAHMAEMALFMVNTGLRDQELCGLRWEWECQVSGTDRTIFILPEEITKNGRERIVPLNSVARSIIEERRGIHPEYVFTYQGERRARMIGWSWRKARERAGLPDVRVHDLRHTFGMRLRAAGVSYEDRQDLLGHHAGRITTHYSRVEISHLINCVELLCEHKRVELTLIRSA